MGRREHMLMDEHEKRLFLIYKVTTGLAIGWWLGDVLRAFGVIS